MPGSVIQPVQLSRIRLKTARIIAGLIPPGSMTDPQGTEERGKAMAHIDDPETQRANLNYIKASMREPLLSRDHEFELAVRWREEGDEESLHELVRAYTRLVVATASKFRNYGLPMGDLVQEGNVGLMQAAARFEPGREVRFSTYAAWWIRSAMQDYILRNWSIVRTGTTAAQKSLFFNLRRLRARMAWSIWSSVKTKPSWEGS